MWKKMVYANLLIMSSLLLCGVSISEGWYRDNYRIFSTQGHPKSKGLNMTIKYPGDWTAYEGERPNVVQVFAPDTEKNITFMIIARELPIPENQTLTDEELEDFFSHEEAISMIPPGSKLISYRKTKIERLPAGILEYRTQTDRAGLQLEVHLVSYYLIYDKIMVFIQFSVGNIPELRKQIDNQFEQLRPTFFQIANSIVLPDKWTKSEDSLKTRVNESEASKRNTIAFFAVICISIVVFILFMSNSKNRNNRVQKEIKPTSNEVMNYTMPNEGRPSDSEQTYVQDEITQESDNETYEQNQNSILLEDARLKKFNWGAFLIAPLWNLTYKRWGWLLIILFINILGKSVGEYWIYFIVSNIVYVLSAKNANKAGWRNRGHIFGSVDNYLNAQKKWVLWGVVIYVVLIGLQFIQAFLGA